MKEFAIHINRDLKPLGWDSSVGDLKRLSKISRFTHIPIVSDSIYEGCLAVRDIQSANPEACLEEFRKNIDLFHIKKKESWAAILDIILRSRSNFMPVIDDKGKYLGYYKFNDLLDVYRQTSFVSIHGATIILERDQLNFSWGEITQVVESNGYKVLGLFVSKYDLDLVEVVLKVDQIEIDSLLQVFRRYGYRVISSHDVDRYVEELKDRIEYLDKYINL